MDWKKGKLYKYDLKPSDGKDALTVEYAVMNPTGNITALVVSETEIGLQPAVADEIMKRHPEVEQVGFFGIFPDKRHESTHGDGEMPEQVSVNLRMAGGEFCGNASMCAGVLHYSMLESSGKQGLPWSECLQVSGTGRPVTVKVLVKEQGVYRCGVRMPAVSGIRRQSFSCPAEALSGALQGERTGDLAGELPVVLMEGITHIIIEPSSVFWQLLEDKAAAEGLVAKWCDQLAAEGLGLMFLKEDTSGTYQLTPLVYVPGSGTCFWEHSCASGSAAVGRYLEENSLRDRLYEVRLQEPGGPLRVTVDPETKETWLYGQVC